jgi:3-oxoacyl-(acyl-carrier-protein) synthase
MVSTWAALLAGKSGIRDEAAGLLRGADLPVTIAAPMSADPAQGMTPARARRLDRAQQAALAAAALVSIEYGARAGAYTPVSACASGAEALALSARLIRAGEADVVIAGGTEAAIIPIAVASFAQATALSRYAGDPAAASRPFAADRDGFVLGEGAGVAVLESAAHASGRYWPGRASPPTRTTSPRPRPTGPARSRRCARRSRRRDSGPAASAT